MKHLLKLFSKQKVVKYFETVRRMYNNTTMQYQLDTLGALCKALECEIGDLLEIIEEPGENGEKI